MHGSACQTPVLVWLPSCSILGKHITLASCPFNNFTRPLTILPNQNTFRVNRSGGTVKMRTVTSVLRSAISDLCCHMCLKNHKKRMILANNQEAKRHTPLTVYMREDRHPCRQSCNVIPLLLLKVQDTRLTSCTDIKAKRHFVLAQSDHTI